MYSANMGPIGQGWHLPYRVEWPVLGRDGLTLALPEITAFVVETVVPYLAQHTSPQAIRDTFLEAPRHADGWLRSEEIVFAIDHMLGQKERLESDRDALLRRKVAPEDRRQVESAFLQVKSAF